MEADRIALYRRMLTSRRVEEGLATLWNEGRISGEMHVGIGEEGIIAGVVDHLGDGDAMAVDHRSTAAMVMRGVDIAAIIKECLGRRDGLCSGMGGHMHLYSREHLAASSGIVGAAGPAACGFAFAHQHLRPGKVAVAFFGEGAMNQGMLMESLNLASCWRLPVVFVCKDNSMAITTPSASVTGGDLCDRARSFAIPTEAVDGRDVEAVWAAAGSAVERARTDGGPAFLYASCTRPDGHFLGDPLLRIVRRPVSELKDKIGPLMAATTSLHGGGVGARAISLAAITGALGKAAKMLTAPGWDPIARLRRRLGVGEREIADLDREILDRVRAAIDEACRAGEEVAS